MNHIKALGQFLRILDENNQLSITNIAVIIMLFKLAVVPVTTLTEIVPLLITIMSYSHKRHLSKKSIN